MNILLGVWLLTLHNLSPSPLADRVRFHTLKKQAGTVERRYEGDIVPIARFHDRPWLHLYASVENDEEFCGVGIHYFFGRRVKGYYCSSKIDPEESPWEVLNRLDPVDDPAKDGGLFPAVGVGNMMVPSEDE